MTGLTSTEIQLVHEVSARFSAEVDLREVIRLLDEDTLEPSKDSSALTFGSGLGRRPEEWAALLIALHRRESPEEDASVTLDHILRDADTVADSRLNVIIQISREFFAEIGQLDRYEPVLRELPTIDQDAIERLSTYYINRDTGGLNQDVAEAYLRVIEQFTVWEPESTSFNDIRVGLALYDAGLTITTNLAPALLAVDGTSALDSTIDSADEGLDLDDVLQALDASSGEFATSIAPVLRSVVAGKTTGIDPTTEPALYFDNNECYLRFDQSEISLEDFNAHVRDVVALGVFLAGPFRAFIARRHGVE